MELQIIANESKLNELSEKIIGAAFEVSNILGVGFLEKVYENALNVELKLRGLQAQQQAPLKVHYKDELVGDYFADILVENEIIIELKTVKEFDDIHIAQSELSQNHRFKALSSYQFQQTKDRHKKDSERIWK